MKWLLIVPGVLVAVVAVVALVGALLPAGHVAARTARYSRPPEAVWAAITDLEAAPSWRPGITKMERLPDRGGKPVWRESGRFGDMTFEVTELDPPRRMVTTIADPDLPFSGRWTYDVRPAGQGSELTVTEEGEVHNPIFRFMSRFVFGHHRTIEGYLKALGRRLGEDVHPVPPGMRGASRR